MGLGHAPRVRRGDGRERDTRHEDRRPSLPARRQSNGLQRQPRRARRGKGQAREHLRQSQSAHGGDPGRSVQSSLPRREHRRAAAVVQAGQRGSLQHSNRHRQRQDPRQLEWRQAVEVRHTAGQAEHSGKGNRSRVGSARLALSGAGDQARAGSGANGARHEHPGVRRFGGAGERF